MIGLALLLATFCLLCSSLSEQGMQTLKSGKLVCWPAPSTCFLFNSLIASWMDRNCEQALQEMAPQSRQWCFRLVRLKLLPQLGHRSTSMSSIHWTTVCSWFFLWNISNWNYIITFFNSNSNIFNAFFTMLLYTGRTSKS